MTLRPLLRKFKSDVVQSLRSAFVGGLALTGSAALVYAAVYIVWPAVVAHPYFRLSSVRVRCDNSALGAREIAERAGLYAGESLWQVNVAAAVAELEKPAWVEKATVERRFPSRVSVEVKERKPIAAAPAPNGPYFVDASGIVYRPVGPREYPDVPYLTGWQAAADETVRVTRLRTLLELARGAEEHGIRLSQVDVDRNGDYWLYPDGRPMPIRLGSEVAGDTIFARLRTALARIPETATAVREIDASYADRIVLRTWQGGYTTLVAELAGETSKDTELAKAKKQKSGSSSDRG
jgi:cell division protein FtsQ